MSDDGSTSAIGSVAHSSKLARGAVLTSASAWFLLAGSWIALVLGQPVMLVGVVLSFPLGIVALVLASIELSRVAAGSSSRMGRKRVVAALVLSILHVGGGCLSLVAIYEIFDVPR